MQEDMRMTLPATREPKAERDGADEDAILFEFHCAVGDGTPGPGLVDEWTTKHPKHAAAIRERAVDILDMQARMSALKPEADRIMVRYVDAEEVDRGDVWTWVLDPGPTGHRAPFRAGDLVMRARGRDGVHVVLDVEDETPDGKIRLRVKDTVPGIDADAF